MGCSGFGDGNGGERFDPGEGVVGAQLNESAVDHESYPVDGDGGFGDVGADDYFAVVFRGDVEDGELPVAWETGVEREGEELRSARVKLGGAFSNGKDCTLDFFAAGEEY